MRKGLKPLADIGYISLGVLTTYIALTADLGPKLDIAAWVLPFKDSELISAAILYTLMLLENIATVAMFLGIAVCILGYFRQGSVTPVAVQFALGAMLIYAVLMLPMISGFNTSFWLYVFLGRALVAFVIAYGGLRFGQYLRSKNQKIHAAESCVRD